MAIAALDRAMIQPTAANKEPAPPRLHVESPGVWPDATAAQAAPDAHPVRDAMWTGVKDAGSPLYRFLDTLGNHLILIGRALAWLPRRPFRADTYLDAAAYIGFGSLPIVLLVGAFTGMVMSLQSVNAFREFGVTSYAGGLTGKALALELAPVLTALMLGGRAGAGIATELGSMKTTEQIEALESIAVDPIQYLVLPRLIAGMIVAPILSLAFVIVGMGGAYVVAVLLQHVDHGQWIANVRDILQIRDVVQGCIKAMFFGFTVALVSTYQGFHASGGARGIGIGTTRAVVIAAATTLVLDYFLSDILIVLLPPLRSSL